MKIADDKATLANIVLEAIGPPAAPPRAHAMNVRAEPSRAEPSRAEPSRAEPSRALSPQLFAVDDPSRPSDLLGGLQLRLDKSPRNKKVCFGAHSFRRATARGLATATAAALPWMHGVKKPPRRIGPSAVPSPNAVCESACMGAWVCMRGGVCAHVCVCV